MSFRCSRPRLLIALLVVLVLAACGSNSDSTDGSAGAQDPGATDEGGPVTGGSFVMLTNFANQGGWDPIEVTNVRIYGRIMFAIYDGLVIDAPDGASLRLADSFTSSDGITWELKLKPDATFSDGTPFNAEAVKFNWERLQDPANEAPQARIADEITSMEVVDDLTLEITLAGPNGDFPTTIALSTLNFIGSPTAIEADPDGFGDHPVGAGAFTVEKWAPGSELTVVKNPAFYGDAPYLDEVVFRVVTDETSSYNSVVSGSADMFLTVSTQTAIKARDDSNLNTMQMPINGGTSNFTFNVTTAPFDDIRARQAIAYALDRDALNEAVYGGHAPVADAIFLEDSPYYDESLTQVQPDRDKAQALFDELAADGKPLDFTMLTFAIWLPEAEWFLSELQSYDNVDVDIEQLQSIGDLITRSSTQQFEAVWHGQFSVGIDDMLRTFFYTAQPANYSGYSNPAVDAAFDDARAALDPEVRVEASHTIQRALLDDLPVLFPLHPDINLVMGKDVHGVEASPANNIPVWDRIWKD